MENESPQAAPQKKSSMMPIAIVVAIVVIIIVGAVAFTMNGGQDTANEAMQTQPTQAVEGMEAQPTDAMMMASYADGEYQTTGMYTSPGGEESIEVTLTLENGIVTDSEVVSNATRPISKQMQEAFIGGYKEQVIGKRIDEINLSKISTSSLAPKGFNDAVEKIKVEAQA